MGSSRIKVTSLLAGLTIDFADYYCRSAFTAASRLTEGSRSFVSCQPCKAAFSETLLDPVLHLAPQIFCSPTNTSLNDWTC